MEVISWNLLNWSIFHVHLVNFLAVLFLDRCQQNLILSYIKKQIKIQKSYSSVLTCWHPTNWFIYCCFCLENHRKSFRIVHWMFSRYTCKPNCHRSSFWRVCPHWKAVKFGLVRSQKINTMSIRLRQGSRSRAKWAKKSPFGPTLCTTSFSGPS